MNMDHFGPISATIGGANLMLWKKIKVAASREAATVRIRTEALRYTPFLPIEYGEDDVNDRQ